MKNKDDSLSVIGVNLYYLNCSGFSATQFNTSLCNCFIAFIISWTSKLDSDSINQLTFIIRVFVASGRIIRIEPFTPLTCAQHWRRHILRNQSAYLNCAQNQKFSHLFAFFFNLSLEFCCGMIFEEGILFGNIVRWHLFGFRESSRDQ